MFPIFGLAAALLLGAAVRWLWNAILPELVNANPISYWQAVGLIVLCRILFGNFGGGPGRWNRPDFSEKFGGDHGFGSPWKNKWKEMTDEDRLKFRQEMRRRCGRPPKDE
jgi:hypothetical protein